MSITLGPWKLPVDKSGPQRAVGGEWREGLPRDTQTCRLHHLWSHLAGSRQHKYQLRHNFWRLCYKIHPTFPNTSLPASMLWRETQLCLQKLPLPPSPAFSKAGLNAPLTYPSRPTLCPKSGDSKERMEWDSRSIGISMAPLRQRRQSRTAAWTQGGGCCLAILSTGPRSLLPGLRGLAASSRSNWASRTELSCGKKYNAK